MLILAIESTAHTFGVSLFEKNKVLVNEKKTFQTKKGGMIPYELAEHHIDNFDEILLNALNKSNKKLKQIDLIAFSQSPGMGHSLRVGVLVARSLSIILKKPLIPVNHCIAHLEIGRFESKLKDPLLLYASGANTQIIGFKAKKYRVFGETLDIGIGNFLDSFARDLGLGFPGGPKIEQLALKGKKYIELPYVVKGMDIALAGTLTTLKRIKDKYKKEDLCFSVQETVFAMLTEVCERALSFTEKEELVLGGGVGCNKRLQEMLRIMCEERGVKFFSPKNEYLVDNAAMIAITANLIYNSTPEKSIFSIRNSRIDPYLRTDEVQITYRN